ncbi:MAG TPA: DinB family protein [Lacibacter sp.]|nr:DinB family protein [Lacibacter sp.]
MNNKEVQSIISNLERVLNGQPWYGEAVMPMLRKIHPAVVYINPRNSHAAIEIVYHMIAWMRFTVDAVNGTITEGNVGEIPMNWRGIDPKVHTWNAALEELEQTHKELVSLLHTKDDSLLNQKLPNRDYNYRFLLNGVIQHNIYHLGQIAFLKNLLGE